MKLSGQINQCQSCKQYFSRNSVFDRHRTGEFGKDRRCMTVEEMSADGMRLVEGLWRGEKMPEIAWGAHE